MYSINWTTMETQQVLEVLLKIYGTGRKGILIRFFGEGPAFCKYLESKTLNIDVWDGDSLLQLGTSLPYPGLCV